MDAAGYVALTRQSGLWNEMSIVANNIANSTTTGFRREAMIFAEHISDLGGRAALSSAHGTARWMDQSQGALAPTGSELDFAIQGEGFFLLQGPEGQRLTRAGNFSRSEAGILVSTEGLSVLDTGGAEIFLPPNAPVTLARDGTLSVSGEIIARIGLWQSENSIEISHLSGSQFAAGTLSPLESADIFQGFLEGSNVDPLVEMARLIEVQRGYEMAQKFLEAENDRSRNVIQTLGR